MLVKGQRLGTNLAVQGLRSSLGLSWPQLVLTVARWLSNYCPACPWKEQGESLKPHSSHWVTEREAFHVSWGQGRLSGDFQNLSWELIRIKQATIKHKNSLKWKGQGGSQPQHEHHAPCSGGQGTLVTSWKHPHTAAILFPPSQPRGTLDGWA